MSEPKFIAGKYIEGKDMKPEDYRKRYVILETCMNCGYKTDLWVRKGDGRYGLHVCSRCGCDQSII